MLTLNRDRRGLPPLRVAVLGSRRAPGLLHLLTHPDRGRRWDVVACVTTSPDSEIPGIAGPDGPPVMLHDIRAFCRDRGTRLGNLATRAAFDRATVARLMPLRVELVLLTGYLHIVTAPLLEAYPDRIVNVHDSDLTLTGAGGLPRYRGLRSTREAMAAGEPETRLTAHLVTETLDGGPLLVRSWGFPVERRLPRPSPEEELQALKRAAWMQRQRMMDEAWGPMLAAVLGHCARGEVRRAGTRVLVAGKPGPRNVAPPHPALLAAVEA